MKINKSLKIYVICSTQIWQENTSCINILFLYVPLINVKEKHKPKR